MLLRFHFLLVFTLLAFHIVHAEEREKNVLYINSYNIGYTWTDEITNGFKSKLDYNPNINYYTEFMDTKRFDRNETFQNFYNYLTQKYFTFDFDIIVASDNNAVDFYIAYKDSSIFLNKTLVFAGISNVEDYEFENMDAYGVVEGYGLEQIFHSMHRLFPDRTNVYAILSESITDSLHIKTIQEFTADYEDTNLKIVVRNNSDSIIQLLKTLGEKDIVYLFNINYEQKKIFKPYINILDQIDLPLSAPIFSGMGTHSTTDKILGGENKKGETHGKILAQMVIRLLNGETISPKIVYPKDELVYNHSELKRFKVDRSLLPRDAVIINKPESIFHKFKQLIIVNVLFIISCLVIIAILIFHNKNQKNNRKKLEEARDKAMQSESIKSSFIANISHEIRTPLNAIIGFSDILMAENTDEILKEYITHIFESSQLLERLVNDVLDLSLIDANEVKLNIDKIHMPEFFNELTKRNVVQIQHYNKPKLKLKAKIPNSGPELLLADKFRLNQIIQNLINNAIKYSFSGTITLSYHFYTKAEVEDQMPENKFDLKHDQYCLISVKDYGIGIPQELKNFVFERFRRLDQVYLGHHGGVGLGLNISKSIINIMGGEIWFTSEQSKGSTFSFIIPHINTSF